MDKLKIADGEGPRTGAIQWTEVRATLDAQGWARIGNLLSPAECCAISALYDDGSHFRSKVLMARHGFGKGEYKYFGYPPPPLVEKLRAEIYPQLVPLANRWNEAMDNGVRYPANHAEFVLRCHKAGQTRPTPLLLRYRSGDYNCLHQDLYGEHVFPLQTAILLADPAADFIGGEFVLSEQRPRMQSRVSVVPLGLGDAVIFAVHHRPVRGKRGYYKVNMRHGVSELRSGLRHTLGIIFHDAT